jgi:hypothetical protein
MLHSHPERQVSAADLSDHQNACLTSLTSQIEQLNATMREAVDAGLSVELQRSSRHHQAGGYWGDIISPNLVKTST